jgi:hypothetical protein
LVGTGSGSGFGVPGTTVGTGITVAAIVVVDETGLDVELAAAEPTVGVGSELTGGNGFGSEPGF